MCSLSWSLVPEGLGICFNRDESVLRPKALLPKVFIDQQCQFIMPIDPQGKGSWLAVSEMGFAVFLLNDYQGQLKPAGTELISRGLLVRRLASGQSWAQLEQCIDDWDLAKSQPFTLLIFTQARQRCWHFDGRATSLKESSAPPGVYSSGHPKADDIIAQRTLYRQSLNILNKQDLLNLHRGHLPLNTQMLDGNDGRAYSFCMHRPEARTQSMTYVLLSNDKVSLEYWDGQPCETDRSVTTELLVSADLI